MVNEFQDKIKKLRKENQALIDGALQTVLHYSEDEGKKVYQSIVRDWFGEFDSIDVVGSVVAKARKSAFSGAYLEHGELKVDIYVDSDIYGNRKSAEEWRERNPDYAGNQESKDYVLGLQFYEGIIGLPKESHARGLDWINEHYHRRPISLLEKVLTDSRWESYQDDVYSKIETYINKKLAERGMKRNG